MDTQEAAEISKAANAADFAIADTAAVDKIFIADKDGNQALLERSSGRYWKLNGTHLARKDAVDLLLKTFLRARVQRPVPQGELSTVNRLLAGRGKKVEIYQGGETPVKTWYIGTSTQNHTGTYMVLADANGQLAEEPFIVHMEGFTGFLSTRFFTDEREWRYTGMFDYPGNALRRVEVELTEAVDACMPWKWTVWEHCGWRGTFVQPWIRCSGRTASIDFARSTWKHTTITSRQTLKTVC